MDMWMTILIKSVHLPATETFIPVLGANKHRMKPRVEFEKQNETISRLMINAIRSGEIRLNKYRIYDGELYIDEYSLRRG